jgi:hypothetical protein
MITIGRGFFSNLVPVPSLQQNEEKNIQKKSRSKVKLVLSFLNLFFIFSGTEFLGLSSEKTNISKMKKDFRNFIFENCVKSFF